MSVFSPSEREEHLATMRAVFGATREIQERADGYAFQFDYSEHLQHVLARFVDGERRCCPFFGFGIASEPRMGRLWLVLTGEDGAKPFIRAAIGGDLPAELAERHGFRPL